MEDVTDDVAVESGERVRSGRPRVWFAVVMSVLVPGLGHLYAGAPLRAVAVAVTVMAAALLIVGVDAVFNRALVLWLSLLVALVFYLAAHVDAARLARRGRGLRGPGSRRMLLYLTFVLVFGLASNVMANVIRSEYATTYRCTSVSMAPTILAGDFLWSRHHGDRTPVRGEVVAFRNPANLRDTYIKRVVAVPGDVVGYRDGAFIVNGTTVPGWRTHLPGPELALAPDEYFVLGDNIDNSRDSRSFGPIHRDLIVARVAYVYFSLDPQRLRVRWDRIGVRFSHRDVLNERRSADRDDGHEPEEAGDAT